MRKNTDLTDIIKDIFTGLVVALVSIPISMGYSQIAGLPPVYGLYGSVLPILFFGLITSSPYFVFGVDAAPAALTGSLLVTLGITAGSEEAIQLIPVLTLCTALILLLLALFKADRLTRFVSSPVMGGFITGIGTEIILMQVPKLFGGSALHGELPHLIKGIIAAATEHFHVLSFLLGVSTIVIIVVMRKLAPRIPMTVVMMAAGGLLGAFTPLKENGVILMEAPKPGLFIPSFPDISLLITYHSEILSSALTIALIVTAETLLATQSFALKNDAKVNGRRELFAYSAAMAAAAASGCFPVNGSVSRTGIADQFKVRTRAMPLAASFFMVLILLFCTPLIAYLPVPILTGIVISALIGILELELAAKLFKADKAEFIIFLIVFFAVLFAGPMAGVVMGILLSCLTVVFRAAKPSRCYLGCIPGQRGFYSTGRHRGVKPIKGAVLYRFQSPLFFANVQDFKNDIEAAITPDTKVVIIDAGSISSIDITAAEYLLKIYENLKSKGIRFFLTEHEGELNDMLHEFDCGRLLSEWAVVPHIEQALRLSGFSEPWPIEDDTLLEHYGKTESHSSDSQRKVQAQFEWAFGSDAENRMNLLAEQFTAHMIELAEDNENIDNIPPENMIKELIPSWGIMDEERFLDIVEMQLAEYDASHSPEAENDSDYIRFRQDMEKIENSIASYHAALDHKLAEKDSRLVTDLIRARRKRELAFKKKAPKAYERYRAERHSHRQILREKYPELLSRIDEIRDETDKNS